MPYVYGYMRVSHIDSAASGLSVDTALDKMRLWFDYQKSLGNIPDHQWAPEGWQGGPDLDDRGRVKRDPQGNYMRVDADRDDGMFIDLATSAWKKKFLERFAAIRLNARLAEGDIIVFSRLDRSFRSTGDCCVMLEQWRQRGVECVFLDNNYDTRTAAGRAFMQMAAVFAEFESAIKSERMLEIKAHSRKKGQRVNGADPLGYKKLNLDGKTWVPCMEQRAVMAAIVRARHSRHPKEMSWREISDTLERELSVKTGREYRAWPYFGKGKPRFWTPDRCQAGYKLGLAEGWAQLPEGVTPAPRRKRRRRRSTPSG